MNILLRILLGLLAIPLVLLILVLLIPCGIIALLWIFLAGRGRSRVAVFGTPPRPRQEPPPPRQSGGMHETSYDIEYTVVDEKRGDSDRDTPKLQ